LTTKFTQHTQESFQLSAISLQSKTSPEHAAKISWAFDPAPRTFQVLSRQFSVLSSC